VEAYVPDIFIESDSERLDFYRRLYGVSSTDEIQLMRDELRDRFGEYPEEVENLFGVVELKTIASKIGFTKVEILKNQLSLHFPPAEEKKFYESDDGTIAPFQQIMSHIPKLRQYHAHLKQDGKQLKLNATIPGGPKAQALLASIKEVLKTLAVVSPGAKEQK
jgi:transcription-repair coupling factor (superfamily II helicase)